MRLHAARRRARTEFDDDARRCRRDRPRRSGHAAPDCPRLRVRLRETRPAATRVAKSRARTSAAHVPSSPFCRERHRPRHCIRRADRGPRSALAGRDAAARSPPCIPLRAPARQRKQMQIRRHRAHELEPRAASAAEVRDEGGIGSGLQCDDHLHCATGRLARVVARLRARSCGATEHDQQQVWATNAHGDPPCRRSRSSFDTQRPWRLSPRAPERTMNTLGCGDLH